VRGDEPRSGIYFPPNFKQKIKKDSPIFILLCGKALLVLCGMDFISFDTRV
jgi:hypothetical protein